MANLRRSLFALIAAAILLFGFGSSIALAWPAVSGAAADHSDCCGETAPDVCALPNCSVLCHAIAPDMPWAVLTVERLPDRYWSKHRLLNTKHLGPEPPPPRISQV